MYVGGRWAADERCGIWDVLFQVESSICHILWHTCCTYIHNRDNTIQYNYVQAYNATKICDACVACDANVKIKHKHVIETCFIYCKSDK